LKIQSAKNIIEKKIFQKLVSDLKNILKKYLGFVINFWKKMKHSFQVKNDIKPPSVTFSVDDRHVFFGYYDLSPFNQNETKLLAMQVDAPLKSPEKNNQATVGYYEILNEKQIYISVGKTSTWNWQQGCRLQWFPSEKNDLILYNCLLNDHYGAKIQDVDRKEIIAILQTPIYDLSSSGNWGLSLNFSRLQRLRPGYGYVNLHDDSEKDLCPANDGVWLVDIHKDNKKLLFSLQQISSLSPHKSMHNAQHYINHLKFNPSGNTFLFFHLWLDENHKRHVRLFTSDFEGNRLTLLNNSGHVSHYNWLSDDKLIITTFVAPNQLRYVLYHSFDGLIDIIGNQQLKSDGHPTFLQSGSYILTDTYPDELREQKLLLFNHQNLQLKVIDRFYSSPKFSGEVRCDLHPRISPSEKLICVDCVKNNYRAMCLLDLSSFFHNQ
jgi:hypothetical protein